MLEYKEHGVHLLLNMFRCYGSVFPYTMLIGTPCALFSALLNFYFPHGSLTFFEYERVAIMSETQAWGGFSFLLGFLIVFRTTQAYGRFWEGCTCAHRMRAEWFDAVSSVVAFTKHSQASDIKIKRFKELLVRLTSMLHAAALAELEAGETQDLDDLWAYNYDIIDPDGVDAASLQSLQQCKMKVNLIFQWIQQLIVENINTGILSVPPPLLSRSFQELANGMVAYHDAMKIAYIPFPFPYSQACDGMLILHWCIVPIVTSQWVANPIWAATLCFIQVFILWGLNLIAIEIDKPFGKDRNDIDGEHMQNEMNMDLELLISDYAAKTPFLIDKERDEQQFTHQFTTRSRTLNEVFFKATVSEPSITLQDLSPQGNCSDETASHCSTSLALANAGESVPALDSFRELSDHRVPIDVIAELERLESPGNPGLEAFGRPVLDSSNHLLETSHEDEPCMLQTLPSIQQCKSAFNHQTCL